ncbi:MCE family protein [Mycolicibacterium vinylchloridicum]|uniref:MCE family protein n=1 Tax=Mycolicibacterium vinylchloridicum TaxID=2736928 RepID=UPI0015CEEBFA|nr:MCE family protein [Mycolicibacterium vinylchloridicum]
MLKYRAKNLARAGFIGAVLVILVILVGLQPERLSSWATALRYQAVFVDASGITEGNAVTISGLKVGSVSAVALDRGHAVVTFAIDGAVVLGSQTTAHIRTGSLLGERVLTLDSAGSGRMNPNDVVPLVRTTTPYVITEATTELTTNVAGTDTTSLNQSLDTLSATLDQIAPQLGPAFDGLSRMSKALNERDDTLADLLKRSNDVTKILANQSAQVNTLILNANDLVQVLADRRQAIVSLLANTSAVAQQLKLLVKDNEAELAPTLQKLNAVTAVLEKNRDNIGKALPGLAKFQNTLGEVVASGPYYTAYIPNIALPQVNQALLDYIWGFRRGTDAGQPPDNAGPRAEFPFPYNAIPQVPR